MKIWITGIAGFLGSHLAEQLLKEGHDVSGNDNFVCGDGLNIRHLGIEWKNIDCCDRNKLWCEFLEFKPDVVVHAAALAHEGFSPYSPYTIAHNVYSGSISTFSAAIASGVKRIVFMSTMARYGKGKALLTCSIEDCEPPFREDFHVSSPCDPYAIAKVAAEDTLKSLCEVHGVKWSIACPHNIIGTRQKYNDPYRNVVSIFMNRNLQGKPAVIYGDGEQTRCFSPIGDVLPSLVKMVSGEADGEIVNIGPDSAKNTLSINQLAERIANLTQYNGKPDYYPERGCDAKHAHCSADKSRKLLGFEETQDLDKCLADMAMDIRLKGTKPFDYFLPIEIDSDLAPKTWKEKLL
jgi:UDP-glucose 4-epimerase